MTVQRKDSLWSSMVSLFQVPYSMLTIVVSISSLLQLGLYHKYVPSIGYDSQFGIGIHLWVYTKALLAIIQLPLHVLILLPARYSGQFTECPCSLLRPKRFYNYALPLCNFSVALFLMVQYWIVRQHDEDYSAFWDQMQSREFLTLKIWGTVLFVRIVAALNGQTERTFYMKWNARLIESYHAQRQRTPPAVRERAAAIPVEDLAADDKTLTSRRMFHVAPLLFTHALLYVGYAPQDVIPFLALIVIGFTIRDYKRLTADPVERERQVRSDGILLLRERDRMSSAWFYHVGVLVTMILFPLTPVVMGLTFLAVCDPLAGYVGSRYGGTLFARREAPFDKGTSWEGSLAAGAAGFAFAHYWLNGNWAQSIFGFSIAFVIDILGRVGNLLDDNFVWPISSAMLWVMVFGFFEDQKIAWRLTFTCAAALIIGYKARNPLLAISSSLFLVTLGIAKMMPIIMTYV